jgi:hypothetical protein
MMFLAFSEISSGTFSPNITTPNSISFQQVEKKTKHFKVQLNQTVKIHQPGFKIPPQFSQDGT